MRNIAIQNLWHMCAFNTGKQVKWIENVCKMIAKGKKSWRQWRLEIARNIRWIFLLADRNVKILCFSRLQIIERKMGNKCVYGICGFVLGHDMDGLTHFGLVSKVIRVRLEAGRKESWRERSKERKLKYLKRNLEKAVEKRKKEHEK